MFAEPQPARAGTIVAHELDCLRRQLRQTERMASIGWWRLSIADQRIEWSDQVFVIHGLAIGVPPQLRAALEFYPPHARTMIAAALERTIATGRPFDLETDLNTVCGLKRRVRCMGELEVDAGRPHAVVGVFQDITGRYELEQALRRSASIDGLTGIANRASFDTHLDACIERARERGEPLALLLVDLDDFKRVNDGFGHLAGDEALQGVARQLQRPYLAECFVARLGGDEFAVIVSSSAGCAAVDTLVAQLLVDLQQIFVTPTGNVRISATIGVGRLDAEIRGRNDLIQRADAALYAAKRHRAGPVAAFRARRKRDDDLPKLRAVT